MFTVTFTRFYHIYHLKSYQSTQRLWRPIQTWCFAALCVHVYIKHLIEHIASMLALCIKHGLLRSLCSFVFFFVPRISCSIAAIKITHAVCSFFCTFIRWAEYIRNNLRLLHKCIHSSDRVRDKNKPTNKQTNSIQRVSRCRLRANNNLCIHRLQ